MEGLGFQFSSVHSILLQDMVYGTPVWVFFFKAPVQNPTPEKVEPRKVGVEAQCVSVARRVSASARPPPSQAIVYKGWAP